MATVAKSAPPFVSRMSLSPRLEGKVASERDSGGLCETLNGAYSKSPAVISGASRGFGQGIAVRFVEEGAK